MTNDTNYRPQQIQPNPPNQSPEEKPHAAGFKTDEERAKFFQNVVELTWRDGVIKRNTIPAFMQLAVFATTNMCVAKVKGPMLRANPRDPHNHL